MTYTVTNFKNKASIKRSLNAGDKIEVFEPGLGTAPTDGTVYLEGPHFPAPHTWYGKGTMEEGLLIKIT